MLLSIFAYRTVKFLVNDHIAFSTFLIYVFAEFIHNVILHEEFLCTILYYLVLSVMFTILFKLYHQSPIWATGIE